MSSGVDIVHLEADQVAASEFPVQVHVERREITHVVCHFQSDTDGADMLGQKWALLADDAALIPRRAHGA